MLKNLKSSMLIYCFTFSLLACSSNENEKVEATPQITDAQRKEDVGKHMVKLGGELHFDSLKYDYTIQASEMIGKKIYMDKTNLDDIYQDTTGVHITVISPFHPYFDSHIDLKCSPEQAKYLLDNYSELQEVYLTMIPETVKRINQRLVVNADNVEADGDGAYVEVDRKWKGSSLKITGTLLNIELQD